uniref:Selenoprotein O n=1 Tax=Mycena chlorophos TaxID=658473 RepID=A0ABQ0MDJ6_MYCCL|nr:predicted protein [Mycena chlorophos]
MQSRSTISRLPLPKQPLLIHKLTPDPRTPTKTFREVLNTNPSIQRRARLLAPEAHFSFVSPFPAEFPYAIQYEEADAQRAIDAWLAAREPKNPQAPNEQLCKYTRDQPTKAVLLGVTEAVLRDCLPHLDVGDALDVVGTPALVPEPETATKTPNGPRDDLIEVLSGQAVLMSEEFSPWALRYSGHQFGTFAGQLGDGRATTILVTSPPNEPDKVYELQLKGSGRTPFSRSADGLAVVRSSIREFLGSEAVHALGIPTTRALALISLPDLAVYRETEERAAILTRVAPSFLRIGSFEALSPPQNVFIFGGGQQPANWEALRILGEWVAGPVLRLPEMQEPGKAWGSALLLEIARRNARMAASWQAYGYMNGVMNTDNISVLGLTIDYGPYSFMDAFDWYHITNHDDAEARYAYRSQPAAIIYALRALNNALAPLLGAENEKGAAITTGWAENVDKEKIEEWRKVGLEFKDELERVAQDVMADEYGRLMKKRLALRRSESADEATLVRPLLDLMAKHKLDFHATFRVLTDFQPGMVPSTKGNGPNTVLDTFVERLLAQAPIPSGLDPSQATQDLREWLALYARRIEREADAWEGDLNSQRTTAGRAANPRFVLRQWVLQEVIAAVEKDAVRGRRIMAKVLHMACNPFEPWGGENVNETEVGKLSAEEREERRFCGFGAKELLGFQCSCSS